MASDAGGLGAFAGGGTSCALESGTSYFIAAFMGVITGVGGGVLRDVFARRMPLVFVGEIYAV
ncbi:MAG: TRIC cation channel family protein, partial [Actinomycetota bacterium]